MNKIGIEKKDLKTNVDIKYVNFIENTLENSKEIDKIVILAMDYLYNDDATINKNETGLYISNDYVIELCKKNKNFIPSMSIHPARKDTLDEIQKYYENGVRILKWIPCSQNIDPSNKKYKKIYQSLSDKKIILLSHLGTEHALPNLFKNYQNPELLKLPLEEGVKVIGAHCALKVFPWEKNYKNTMIEMLKNYDNFYGDTAAFALPLRFNYVKSFLKNEGIFHKLIHGSDFPVPVIVSSFLGNLGFRKLKEIYQTKNLLDKDVIWKKKCGFPEHIFTKMNELLN